MLTAIHTTTIFVSDQDKALDFYVGKLGFEKRQDQAMGPESRWIEVAPPGRTTTLLLYKPTPEAPGADSYETARARIGKSTGVLLTTDDVNATYKELSAKGVAFPTPPEQQPWGWWAEISDPDGNMFGIGQ
jgi:predicted enzyme related to lactoylglutathione lyase